MKNNKNNQTIEEPVNQGEVYNKMLSLFTQIGEIDHTRKEAEKQSKEIRKELKRLDKISKEYLKEKLTDLKKKKGK